MSLANATQTSVTTTTTGSELLDWTDLVDEHLHALKTEKKKRTKRTLLKRHRRNPWCGDHTVPLFIERLVEGVDGNVDLCQELKMKTLIKMTLERVMIRELKPVILQSVKQAIDAACQSSAGHKRSHTMNL